MNALSAAAAAASIQDADHMASERRENARIRQFVIDAFDDLGYPATNTHTNFVFVDLGQPASVFRDACAEHDILVGRDFPPMEQTHCRISRSARWKRWSGRSRSSGRCSEADGPWVRAPDGRPHRLGLAQVVAGRDATMSAVSKSNRSVSVHPRTRVGDGQPATPGTRIGAHILPAFLQVALDHPSEDVTTTVTHLIGRAPGRRRAGVSDPSSSCRARSRPEPARLALPPVVARLLQPRSHGRSSCRASHPAG